MRKVDWQIAKDHYLSNRLITLKEVADTLHVAAITIRIRAGKEKWFAEKQVIYRQVDKRLREFETERYVEKLVSKQKIVILTE